MKKYLAEMIGTMVLVFIGCGSAIFNNGCGTPAQVLMVAVAFGVAVVAMAYTIGGISGCHINPAITLGVWMSGRMSGKDAGMYMLFQVIGGFIGSLLLYIIIATMPDFQSATLTGANYCEAGAVPGLVAEIIFTCVFVLVVLGTTDSKVGAGNFAGLAIGLSLVIVHIALIPITGTSVNPARSLAPAVFNGGDALAQVWVYIIGPFIGGALAACIWGVLSPKKK
ncbi:MAG: MIP family channel protein [Prevotella sp.]|nr:MIP family channel protein [Prevotella sp.]